MRPPAPEPFTSWTSTPSSRAARRTDGAAGAGEAHGAAGGLDHLGGIAAQEGVAGDGLAAFDALEEEGVAAGVMAAQRGSQALIGGDGRVLVGHDLPEDGHEVSLAGDAAEGVAVGLVHGGVRGRGFPARAYRG